MEMDFDVQSLLQHYGYAGVFLILLLEPIGIPFPAETTLTISGIAWSNGVFALLPLLLAASIGNIVGSLVAYLIGRYLGRPVILRYGRYVGITPKRLDKATATFEKYQATVVLFSKFIAGIRILVPYIAGMNRMPLLLFTVYTVAAALVWAATFIILGRSIEMQWARYHHLIYQYSAVAAVIAVVLVGLYIFLKVRARRRER
jgi:membrane protein DedA with SNARE-associated domain